MMTPTVGAAAAISSQQMTHIQQQLALGPSMSDQTEHLLVDGIVSAKSMWASAIVTQLTSIIYNAAPRGLLPSKTYQPAVAIAIPSSKQSTTTADRIVSSECHKLSPNLQDINTTSDPHVEILCVNAVPEALLLAVTESVVDALLCLMLMLPTTTTMLVVVCLSEAACLYATEAFHLAL